MPALWAGLAEIQERCRRAHGVLDRSYTSTAARQFELSLERRDENPPVRSRYVPLGGAAREVLRAGEAALEALIRAAAEPTVRAGRREGARRVSPRRRRRRARPVVRPRVRDRAPNRAADRRGLGAARPPAHPPSARGQSLRKYPSPFSRGCSRKRLGRGNRVEQRHRLARDARRRPVPRGDVLEVPSLGWAGMPSTGKRRNVFLGTVHDEGARS